MNEFVSLTFDNDKKLIISLDIFTLLTIYYYS
jgi:hypothetical protein